MILMQERAMGVTEKERKNVTVDLVKCACTVAFASSMPNKALSEMGGSIVGPLVPTITRAAPGASTLVASATAEQTKAGRRKPACCLA
jgi:hypothetical protein